jgi:hypothetical protein
MRRMLLVLIAAASAMFASAQIQFGVKAAYNFANLTISPSESVFSAKSDFSEGVLASIPLLARCSLQPEILYSGQGVSFSDSFATGKINYSYLNFPVLFKYPHSMVFVETGPQFGFLLSAKETGGNQSVDFRSQTRSADFSWVFGFGFKLPLSLSFDARANVGLTNIAKGNALGDATARNSVVQIGLFCMFSKL